MSIYTYTNEQFQVIHSNLSDAFNIDLVDVDFGTTTIHSVPKNSYSGIYHPMYGRTHTEQSRRKMSESQKKTDKHPTRGKKRPEFSKLISGKNNPMYGVPCPNYSKGSKADTLTCPHCGKVGGKPAMVRWHFDNCKSR